MSQTQTVTSTLTLEKGASGGSGRTLSRSGSLSGSGSKRETAADRVNRLLKEAGVHNPEDKSRCLRAGLAKGFYKFTGAAEQLDTVVWQGKCQSCRAPGEATLKELLEQPDDGLDHGQGGRGAAVSCKQCKEGIYVTRLCEGKPERDTGKFHGHCGDCSGPTGLGVCTGNAQNQHCKKCGDHYDAGVMQTDPCPCATQTACCVVA